MFLGFDDSLRPLKKEFKDAGVNMDVVRDWQKYYDKVRRQAPQLEGQYQKAKGDLETVYAVLKKAEQLLIACKSSAEAVKVDEFAREMKKYQGSFNHEFLISKEDSEFHLTYATMLGLCGKTLREQKDVLILQSEVENLMALTKEALEKEWPAFRAMAFYYIERSDKEIFDLPHSDKVDKVHRVYENEFLKPLRDALKECLPEERVNNILENEIWDL